MWRACERFSVLPPGVRQKWDDIVPWVKCQMLAYSMIRDIEDSELAAAGLGAKI